jgi:hypothetical protein
MGAAWWLTIYYDASFLPTYFTQPSYKLEVGIFASQEEGKMTVLKRNLPVGRTGIHKDSRGG